MTPICTMWLWGFSLMIEAPKLLRHSHPPPWLPLLACAVLGMLVNFVSLYVIKKVGALTLKLMVGVRNAALVVANVLFFGDLVSPSQFAWYAISLGLFVLYNYLRLETSE
jgi:Co/Zn/Cd efflux system component